MKNNLSEIGLVTDQELDEEKEYTYWQLVQLEFTS
jgi:hypothetical protein